MHQTFSITYYILVMFRKVLYTFIFLIILFLIIIIILLADFNDQRKFCYSFKWDQLQTIQGLKTESAHGDMDGHGKLISHKR